MANTQPPTIPVPLLGTDPGYLLWAPFGTADPSSGWTVTGGVFTDIWPSTFIPLGGTDAGSTFNWQTTFEQITAAEFLDPLKYATSGRTGSIAFALLAIHMNNLKRALNGGSVTTTGSTTTTMSIYTPPAAGAETRCVIGWESQDSTERLVAFQCINTAQVSITRNKGANKATIPTEWAIETPAGGGAPFKYATAGVARLGV